MLRGTGRELTNQRSKMRVLQAPGYTRTYTGRKAILRMPRIGTSARASLRAAVRFERNGLRLQKLSSANLRAIDTWSGPSLRGPPHDPSNHKSPSQLSLLTRVTNWVGSTTCRAITSGIRAVAI